VTDWVPYNGVVGDRELESGLFGVNVRGEDEETEMTADELLETVDEEVGDLPRRPRYLPRYVSTHPNFTGR
jgi:threonyl-tRNA synthetase